MYAQAYVFVVCMYFMNVLYLSGLVTSRHDTNSAVKNFLYNTHAVNKGIFCLWYKIRLNRKPNRKNRLTEISVSWILVSVSVFILDDQIDKKNEQ